MNTDRQTYHQLLFVLALFAAAALTAPQASIAAVPKPPGTDVGVTDADLQVAVEAQLMADPAVSSHGIDVAVENGIVSLNGKVDNLLSKDRAVTVTESIKGVSSVIDRVMVVTQKIPDDELHKMVIFKIASSPAYSENTLSVSVSDGVVTLGGVVNSWQKSFIYERLAKSVRGVSGISNKIKVIFDMRRDDDEIAHEVRQRLGWDAFIDSRNIVVDVDRGEVSLSGVVGSAHEKRRATSSAWVIGVSEVDTDSLMVDWNSHRRSLHRTHKTVIVTDDALKEAIGAALDIDPRVNADAIMIHVDHGVVALTGHVGSLASKRAVEQDVQNTRGVRLIRNYIKVRPGIHEVSTLPMIDQDIRLANDVRRLLKMDPLVPQDHISVTVNNGVVRLGGRVSEPLLKARAENITAQLRGAVHIINDIDADPEWIPREDWVIQRDVENELYWSPFVDSDRIHVEVTDGVVTLIGLADSLVERRIATRNAYEGGAKSVRNNLRLDAGGRQ